MALTQSRWSKRAAFLLLLLLLLGTVAVSVTRHHTSSVKEPPTPVAQTTTGEVIHPCCCAPSSVKQEVAAKSSIDPVFGEFQEWAEKAATEKPDAAEIARGVELARTRRTAMSKLIKSDPKRALEETLPYSLRSAMPNDVSTLLEERVDTRGSYMVAIADGFDLHSNVSREVQANGKTYHASVYGKRVKQSSLLDVPLHGIAVDNQIALSESPIRVLDPGELPDPKKPIVNPDGTCLVMPNVVSRSVTVDAGDSTIYSCCAICTAALEQQLSANQGGTGTVAGTPTAASAWSTGPKTVLFIRVDTTDKLGDTITQAAAETLVGTTTSNFYQDCSYNQTSMTCTATTTTLHLPNTASYYANNFAAILSDARAAASAAGYNDSAYDLDVVGTPSLGNGYAGQAYVGAKGAVFYNSYTLYTAGHELGHNYGVWHANYWATTDGTTIGTGSNQEYGYTWSIMSTSFGTTACHFDTYMKYYFNWLSASQVTNVTTSGTYKIYAFDSTSANPLPATDLAALSIPKVGDPSGRVYWVQFRQAFTSDKWRMNGAELIWAPWGSSNGGTQLLDTTPNSANGKNDAPIVIGRTFADRSSGIYITPISKGGTTPESLNVVVNIGSFPGNLPPTVSVSPSATSVATGTAVNFTATASDPNGDTLAYYWDFGDGNFGTNSATASHSWGSAGQYLVSCIVSDMKGGEGQASVIITVGSPTTFNISGKVADSGNNGIEGVLVYTSATKSTYTNSDGTYNLVNLAAGSYTVSAAKQGYTMTAGFTNPVAVGPDATGINFTATIPTFTISGTVTNGGTAVSGVTVSDGTRTALTDSTGNYTLSGVPDGSYTLTATLTGYTFIPSGWTNPVSVQDANITNENFVTPVYSITGTVTGPSSAVTITDGVRTTTSVKQGSKWVYTLSNVPAGTWNIRATLAGWVLTPSFTNPLTVNGNLSNENFNGVAGTVFTVSGNITSSGSPLTGAVVSDGTRSSTTDSIGNYCIINVPNGSYTLTPSDTGYTFSPTNIAVTVSGANLTGKNFTATNTAGPTITTTSPLAAGDANVAYSKTFAATGGSTPYTWSVTSGTPPAGLSLSSAGVLSGTPTTAGTSTFTVTVTDSASRTNSTLFSLTINADPTITTASLPVGDVGTAYSKTLAASGGSGSGYTYSVISGALPTGLALSSAGVISGTPSTVTGSPFSFTVQVADSLGGTGSKAFSITINAALTITTSSPLPGGEVGILYSQTFAATGGTGTLTWSVSSGAVPAGITLSSAGLLSGTPTTAGTSNFTVKVTDAAGAAPTKAMSVTIIAAPSITTASLPGGDLSVSYTQTLAESGGTAPFTWSLSSGALPGGLTLNTSTGGISGTPTATGTFSFTAKVVDNVGASATKALSIVISALPTVTTAGPLPAGDVGTAYSTVTFAASGGTGAYTWSVSVGALPGGLSLNASTGALSGTPTAAGSFSFTIQVKDAAGGTGSKAYTITINPALSITTTSLAGGAVGSAYSQTLVGSGGKTPYTWSVSVGSLPSGLTLNASTGAITGAPTTAGTYNFTIKLTDGIATVTKALSIVITGPLNVNTNSLPSDDVGIAYSQTLVAGGGTPPYTWSISAGSLPTGVSLTASTGALSGTPGTAGTFNFTAKVTDSASGTATKALSITINPAPSITTASPLPNGNVGSAYSQTFAVSGGTPSFTWSLSSGALPAGLSLSSAGALTGTPTTAATSSFTIKATDSVGGFATQAYTLTITPPSLLTTITVTPNGVTLGPGVTQQFSATAYDQNNNVMVPQPSFTWSVNGGGTIDSTGLFTAGNGAGTFTVSASSGTVGSSVNVIVDLPPTIISPPSFNPTTVVTNVPVNFNASGSDPAGGSVNYNWNFGDGSSGTGSNVTHTFTTAGSFTITFTMTNSIGGQTSTTLTITVLDGSAVGGGGSAGQTIPMTVSKLQGSAKFTGGGHDSCTIAGIIPNLPKLYDPTGQTLVLNIDGANVSFTLDSKGRGKNANGSIALKLKPSKRNPTTKKLEFQGGNVVFAAKIMNGTWAATWGLDPKAALSNTSMSIPATITLSGNTYVVTVTTTYSDKPGVGGKFKK